MGAWTKAGAEGTSSERYAWGIAHAGPWAAPCLVPHLERASEGRVNVFPGPGPLRPAADLPPTFPRASGFRACPMGQNGSGSGSAGGEVAGGGWQLSGPLEFPFSTLNRRHLLLTYDPLCPADQGRSKEGGGHPVMCFITPDLSRGRFCFCKMGDQVSVGLDFLFFSPFHF